MMPNYYGNYYSYPYFQPMQQQNVPAAQNAPQIQNGGFVSVRNEQEARSYPVAPGNSVTFKDETAPYVYTKTMGFSQLDRPIFDKYRLVKEEPVGASVAAENEVLEPGVDTSTLDELKGEIKAIWSEIDALKQSGKKATPKRKEDGDD